MALRALFFNSPASSSNSLGQLTQASSSSSLSEERKPRNHVVEKNDKWRGEKNNSITSVDPLVNKRKNKMAEIHINPKVQPATLIEHNGKLDDACILLANLKLEDSIKDIHFHWTENFESLYRMGADVVGNNGDAPPQQPNPNRNAVKCVVHATRVSDNLHVVIKMRNKNRSFKDHQEIQTWVTSMKLLWEYSGRGAHPNVGKVLDCVEDADNYYIIMEYIQGRDLFDYFVAEKIYEKPYKVVVGREVCRQILTGIQALQGEGMLHKDIKLENIVLDEEAVKQEGPKLICKLKVIDFDTVEYFRPWHRSFHVLGTDQYIGPESYSGESGPDSDIWALGVIMYTFLTGTFPFHYSLFDDEPGENYVGHAKMETIKRRLKNASIEWSHRVWREYPVAYDFVKNCLKVERRERLSTEAALAHEFVTGRRPDGSRSDGIVAVQAGRNQPEALRNNNNSNGQMKL